ncbi:MAG: histidine phosphatase family protein [Bacilli bacterium]|nr:histidine phosphatase family protein [Bacilli bacterium]
MIIYYSRHGQTDWNLDRCIQGQSNIPLNETGIQQAKKLGEKIKDLDIKAIYTSPLDRVVNTVKIAKGDRDIPVYKDARILERNYGIYEGKSAFDPDFVKESRILTCDLHGGENYPMLFKRIGSFINELKEKYADDEAVLVVAHGGIARVFNRYFHKMDLDSFFKHYHPNCEIVMYDTKALQKIDIDNIGSNF